MRKLARRLVAWAAGMLPPSRADWARAMESEVEHVEGDLRALSWALGCVLASCVERLHLRSLPARALLALFVGTQVLAYLFATVLTVAWRTGSIRLATLLGSATPGDDYRNFVPLMEATPWWIHALWVAAALLFAASAVLLLLDKAAAFTAFAAAWVLGNGGNLIAPVLPGTPVPPLWIETATLLFPLFVAAALWAHARRCAH